MAKQFTWSSSTKEKRFELKRPCNCGCDYREGIFGVGYIIGNVGDGRGFTIWVQDEEVYRRIRETLGGEE